MHPVLFRLGSITIYSYGVMIALAFLAATYLAMKELGKNPVIKPSQAMDLVLYGLISGILGARGLHVILNIKFYVSQPLQILFLNRGGLAFYGGIFSAVGVSLWYLIRRKLPILKAGDLFIPYVALGHAIGRIGCFLNGCCFGRQDHSTQLYSALGLFIIFLILKFLYKRKHFEGQVFLSYFILYSIFRFFMDFLRADISAVLFGLTASQLISVIVFVAAVVLYKLWRIFD